MKATLTDSNTSTSYTFQIEHDEKIYDVIIHTNYKGKFIDDEISFQDEELDGEGEEGEIREAIIDYLDKNWDNLIDD